MVLALKILIKYRFLYSNETILFGFSDTEPQKFGIQTEGTTRRKRKKKKRKKKRVFHGQIALPFLLLLFIFLVVLMGFYIRAQKIKTAF